MKMRASLARLSACGAVAICVATIILLFAFHKSNAASRQGAAGASLQAATAKTSSDRTDPKWIDAFGRLPMGFEENRGQTNREVKFLSHGTGYELFLTPEEAVLALQRSKPADMSPTHRAAALKALRGKAHTVQASVLRLRLAGANPAPEIAGVNELPGRTNYFIGNNPKDWHADIPSYARVKYSDIYPGVDLVFYGNQRQLEYDYVVAPGADPKAIALDVTGARKLRINAQGNLLMNVPGGMVELMKPVVFQESNGGRRQVDASYALSRDHRVHFVVAEYDQSKPLIVDPILNYSTYLGGSAFGDVGFGIAVDAGGDAYIAGQTFSTTFPTLNGYANEPQVGNTNGAVFVTELNPLGTQEIYSTYLIGNGGEGAYGVAVDSTYVYVTGYTFSTNFPTPNGYIQSPLGSNPGGTGFLAKINSAAPGGTNSLIYSTYVGGTNGDYCNVVAVDSSQQAYVTGISFTSGLTMPGGYQTTLNASGEGNAFVERFDTTQTGSPSTPSLIYGTYLGGSGTYAGNYFPYGDQGFGIAADSSSNAYISGTTTSTDFPVKNSATGLGTFPANNTEGTTFVAEISTAVANNGANSLLYSTFLGGQTVETSTVLALGPSNVAYVTGSTQSTNFPVTAGAYNSTPTTVGVVFVSKINPSLGATSLTYSATIGGNGGDESYGIQVDSSGNAYVAGGTGSPNFPITPGALQSSFATGAADSGFLFELNPGNSGTNQLVYSTYLGGSGSINGNDVAYAIGLDTSANAYVTGETFSTNFPVYPNPGAFQTSLTGSDAASIGAAFVTKLTLTPTVTVSPTSIAFGTVLIGANSTQTVTVTNNTGLAFPLTYQTQTGNSGDFVPAPGGANPCPASGGMMAASNTPCTINVTFTPSVNGAESSNLVVGYSPYGITSSQTVALTGTGTNVAFSVTPATLTFAGQLVTTSSASQPITLTNSGPAAVAFTTGLTDSTDFSVAAGGANPCVGSSVPANSSCTLSVTFNPAAGDTGPLASKLSVMANGSVQTVALTGTGWDFQLMPATQSVSTAPGGTPSPAPAVTVTLLGGFPGPVNLACTGTIPMGSCTITGSVSASGSVPVTIMTKGSSFAPPISMRVPPISPRQMVLIGFTLLLLLVVLPFARRRRAKLGLVGVLVMLIGLTACSGNAGTPAGTYNLTITGSSGTVNHSVAITLTVT